jgi:hypothetical protein
MTLPSFLSTADFVAACVVVVTMVIVSFSAYRRTRMPAFACLLGGSLLFISLAAVLHLYKPASGAGAVVLMEWSHVGHLAATILWGVGFFQLARYAWRDIEQKSAANQTLQATAAPPES